MSLIRSTTAVVASMTSIPGLLFLFAFLKSYSMKGMLWGYNPPRTILGWIGWQETTAGIQLLAILLMFAAFAVLYVLKATSKE